MNADELLKRAREARETLEETQEQKKQLAQLLRESESHEAFDLWAGTPEENAGGKGTEQANQADPQSLDCLTKELKKLNQKLERISLRTSNITSGAEQMGMEFAKSAAHINEIEKYRQQKQAEMANQAEKMTSNNDQVIDSTFDAERDDSYVSQEDYQSQKQFDDPSYDPLEDNGDGAVEQESSGHNVADYCQSSDADPDGAVTDDEAMYLAEAEVEDESSGQGNQLPAADMEESDTVIEENVNSHSLPLPVQHALPEPEDFDPEHDTELERRLIITPPPARAKTIKRRTPPCKILRRKSKKYPDQDYLYSWDIPYKTGSAIDKYEQVKLIRDDCGKSCLLSPDCLSQYLTEENRVSNGRGGWNIKVFKNRQNEVAVSPGKSNGDWVYIKINWKYGR